MPSKAPPPVLHDCAGWSPYQQQTSVARVIESPIAAMLVGKGGAAAAGAGTSRPRKSVRMSVRRVISTAPQRGGYYIGSARGRRRLRGRGTAFRLVALDQRVDLTRRTKLRQSILRDADFGQAS